jgi:hypothetical protein
MQVGVQLTPDGRRFEFELLPDSDMWSLNPVGRSRVNCCNEAGGASLPPLFFERVAGVYSSAFGVPVPRNSRKT